MAVELLESQSERVRHLMQVGGFADEAAVVTAALELLERKQRLHALIQEGVDDLEQGRVLDHETVFAEVRRRIEEIATEQHAGAAT